jgi:hypothetical protein
MNLKITDKAKQFITEQAAAVTARIEEKMTFG